MNVPVARHDGQPRIFRGDVQSAAVGDGTVDDEQFPVIAHLEFPGRKEVHERESVNLQMGMPGKDAPPESSGEVRLETPEGVKQHLHVHAFMRFLFECLQQPASDGVREQDEGLHPDAVPGMENILKHARIGVGAVAQEFDAVAVEHGRGREKPVQRPGDLSCGNLRRGTELAQLPGEASDFPEEQPPCPSARCVQIASAQPQMRPVHACNPEEEVQQHAENRHQADDHQPECGFLRISPLCPEDVSGESRMGKEEPECPERFAPDGG